MGAGVKKNVTMMKLTMTLKQKKHYVDQLTLSGLDIFD